MFSKVIIVASCALIAAVSAKPHIAAVGPAFVTAQSSQVFARTYNGIVPFAVHAVPAPLPVAAAPSPAPVPISSLYLPHPAPAPVFSYPVYTAAAPTFAVATPAVVAAAPAPVPAPIVAATPVAKVVAAAPAKVRTAPYLTTIRYRTIVA